MKSSTEADNLRYQILSLEPSDYLGESSRSYVLWQVSSLPVGDCRTCYLSVYTSIYFCVLVSNRSFAMIWNKPFLLPVATKNPRSETTICQRMPVWHLSALDVGSFYSSVLQLWVSKCTWFHPVWFLLNKPCCLGVCCGGRVYEQMLFAVHLRNSAGTDFLINMFTKAGCRHVVWELWVADRHSCKRKKLLKRILTNIHACLGAGKWISSLINLPY